MTYSNIHSLIQTCSSSQEPQQGASSPTPSKEVGQAEHQPHGWQLPPGHNLGEEADGDLDAQARHTGHGEAPHPGAPRVQASVQQWPT